MKMRHLPVVVDAVIWTATHGALEELRVLGLDEGDYLIDPDSPHRLILHTGDGDRTANPGDAIVRGVLGEFYPVPADVYSRVYRPLDDAEGEFIATNYLEHYAREAWS